MINRKTIIEELKEQYGLDEDFFERYSSEIDDLVQAINDDDDVADDLREDLAECIKDYLDSLSED